MRYASFLKNLSVEKNICWVRVWGYLSLSAREAGSLSTAPCCVSALCPEQLWACSQKMRFRFETAVSSPTSILFKGLHLGMIFTPLQAQWLSPQPSQGRQERTEEPASPISLLNQYCTWLLPLDSLFARLEKKLNSHWRELDQKWSS